MNSPLTPLHTTGIYIVEVLKDAIDFQIENNKLEYWNDYEGNNPDKDNWVGIQLPEGDWQILGTITSDTISFDPAPYLESFISESNKQRCYRDYEYIEKEPKVAGQYFINPESSFRSLLTICGYYWVNPKIKGLNTTTANETDRAQWYEWQSFEDNLVTGILLVLIKK